MSLPPLAFIGGGNMASAIIAGLLRQTPSPAITVCDPLPAARERLAAAGCQTVADCHDIGACEVVILAVKPQMIGPVLPALAPIIAPQTVVVSILAGVRSERIEAGLPPGTRVIRAMPNTPMAIGAGMVGLCRGRHASADDLDLASRIFAASAATLTVEEERMDALTAISGSGPAYCFLFCEALQAAALKLGFSAEEAALLVGQTMAGSIAYLRSQDGFPAARLREQVTSPGGTTAAALAVFANGDLNGLIDRAVQAAQQRSQELSPDPS